MCRFIPGFGWQIGGGHRVHSSSDFLPVVNIPAS